MRVRLLDLGTVPVVESQTNYHAVAYAMTDGTPNTITLMRPEAPYVCIGFHQDFEKEIDAEFCRERGLPVLRREVGGGAVYLDGGQTFVHWIFHREDLPRRVEELYRIFIRPLVQTYREFGIAAEHRPLNDIVVGGRKIGGTGIASIGQAMVVAGSLMFDFDTKSMARALKVSSEKMRDKVFQSLEEYMTTMTRELGSPPPRERVLATLVENLRNSLGVDVEPGEMLPAERRMVGALNSRFESAEWLEQKGGLRRPGITIKSGVLVAEGEHKAPGGLIRATARLKEGRIEDLSISGDFTFEPAPLVGKLEMALRGRPLDTDELTAAVADFFVAGDVQAPGVRPEDIVAALMNMESV
ncbi:MAG: lipoate--protein ligase [Dehalococcoidia bacterium]